MWLSRANRRSRQQKWQRFARKLWHFTASARSNVSVYSRISMVHSRCDKVGKKYKNLHDVLLRWMRMHMKWFVTDKHWLPRHCKWAALQSHCWLSVHEKVTSCNCIKRRGEHWMCIWKNYVCPCWAPGSMSIANTVIASRRPFFPSIATRQCLAQKELSA